MFGVIKIERIGGGFFKRLHYRLFPPEPVIERISVLGSAPFFTLTLVCDENEEVDTGEIYSPARAVRGQSYSVRRNHN